MKRSRPPFRRPIIVRQPIAPPAGGERQHSAREMRKAVAKIARRKSLKSVEDREISVSINKQEEVGLQAVNETGSFRGVRSGGTSIFLWGLWNGVPSANVMETQLHFAGVPLLRATRECGCHRQLGLFFCRPIRGSGKPVQSRAGPHTTHNCRK